jgi:hypothetical protein
MSNLKYRLARVGLIAGCIYEIVAVSRQIVKPNTQSPPTITKIVRTVGAHPYGKLALWAWIGYVATHFGEPLDKDNQLLD